MVSALVGGGLMWVFNYRSQKAKGKSDEASALQEMQNAYDRFVKDANDQIDRMRSKITELENRNQELESLSAKVKRLEDEVADIEKHWQDKLQRAEKTWKDKYDRLKADFEDYKRNHQSK
ncbi:MAG: hypothetical protein GC192_23525 [Bacteroidetes bacterium]|nr:hypothetical protein [Bacteroidota bacterium]